MITKNLLQSVFFIKVGESMGTAFTVERAKKQYLITARHVLKHVIGITKIQIFHEEQWKTLDVKLVGATKDELDIAVLALEFQLAPTHSLELTSGGIAVGQQVYFLGFPLGIMGDSGMLNRQYPFPLIKSGILSAYNFETERMLWVDGHNNPGFSGGPVVFVPGGDRAIDGKQFKVVGVISGYQGSQNPVYDKSGQEIGFTSENSGIIIACEINYAVELIDKNPIGYAVG